MPQDSKLDPFKARLDEWFFLSEPPLKLREARAQLHDDGCDVSLDSLSRWRQRREQERDNELVNDWTEDFEEECRKFMPDASADQRRQFVIHYLMKKGVATGNDKLTLLAVDREQNEITGKTKARQKDRELAQKDFDRLMKSSAFAEQMLKKASELLADGSITPAERIERMRQAMYAELDALQKSGRVQIPL